MSIHNNLKCSKCGRPVHPGACAGGGEEEEKKQDKASKAKADATSAPRHQNTDKTSTTAISKSWPSTLCTLWRNHQDRQRTAVIPSSKQHAFKNLTKEAKTGEMLDPKTSDPQKAQESTGSQQGRKNSPFNIRLTR